MKAMKKLTSVLLALVLLLGMVPLSGMAYAEGNDVAVYTVTFDSAGGSAVKEQKIAEGEKATEPDDPARDGYAFSGWFTEKDTRFNFNTPITEDLRLVAKWTENAPVPSNEDAQERTEAQETAGETPSEPETQGAAVEQADEAPPTPVVEENAAIDDTAEPESATVEQADEATPTPAVEENAAADDVAEPEPATVEQTAEDTPVPAVDEDAVTDDMAADAPDLVENPEGETVSADNSLMLRDIGTRSDKDTVIRDVRVSGLQEPFVVETASGTWNLSVPYDSHYEIKTVFWYNPESTEPLTQPVHFEAGKSYYAEIILRADPGYVFEEDPYQFDVFTLNGSTAWIDFSRSGIWHEDHEYFCISTINFVPKEPTVIKDVQVTGFVEPVAGQIAITSDDLSSPDGAPYTPFIRWKDPESGATLPEPMIFEQGRVYYAEVVLGAHDGYVFEADPHQFDVFTLNGSTAWIDFSRSGPVHENLKGYIMATIRFVSNSYVVTFNANGGTVTPASAMTGVDGKLTSLPTPSREGYSFTGWYSAPSGGSAISLDRVYTEDTTIYAHWVRNTYTITFDPNGGTVTPTSATTNSEGRLDSLPTPTREGYTFLNWCSEPVGGHSIGTSKIYTADTTIYAHWVKKSYTVTFDSHSGSAVPSQTVEYGDKATRPTDPIRGGWIFDDWYVDEIYTAKFDFDTPITGPRTIYAKWIPDLRNFTVTFNVDGGSAVPSQTVIEGGKVTKPDDPTKEGFTFAGWYANSRKTRGFDFENTEIDADTTSYAKWVNPATIQYHVSFMKGTTRILSQQRVYSGDYVARPTAAEVERMEHLAGDGSVLEDWYTDTTYTTKFDFDQPITSNTRIYGKWLEGYTVTFYGHSNNVYKNVDAGKTVSPPENPPVWEGHTILGWYTEWSCINAFDFSTPITENITLYPKWVDNTPTVYTVSFNANGGSGTMTPVTVNIGDKLTLPECGFAPQEGKEFDRWDAGNPGEQVEIVSDCTITAFWRDKAATYTVTFDVNGHGTAPTAQTVNSGETATEPAAPTESGWTFGGWYTEAACATAFDFSTPITADITLYAKWTEESVTPPVPTTYTVTFDANGHGTAPAAQTVEDGNLAAKPTDPTESGWTFGGWYQDATCSVAFDFSTPITANITLYAKWTKDGGGETPTPTTYTVTFDANGHGTAPAAQTVEDGKPAAKPADPTETGWTFGGWYQDATCSVAFDFSTPITANITLYAKWTKDAGDPVPATKYPITYVLNGGTLDGKTGTVTVQVEDGAVITLPKPTRSGYTFDYWVGSRYEAGASYTVTGDHTFTAQWKANSTTGTDGKDTSPKTGDESHIGLWLALMALSMVGLSGVTVCGRKKRTHK